MKGRWEVDTQVKTTGSKYCGPNVTAREKLKITVGPGAQDVLSRSKSGYTMNRSFFGRQTPYIWRSTALSA